MYNDNTNLAYDLSLFDVDEEAEQRRAERRKQREEKAKINMTAKKSVGRNGNAFAAIATAVAVGAVAFSILYSKVQISDYTSMISETKNQIELAERENVRLHSELDSMYTLDNVEKIAKEELGLQKTQSSQINFISLNTEDMTEIAKPDENIFMSVQNWFNSIKDYLGF
ncbi:MAG: hypothetical protein J6X60_12860 [Ruminiclostridium sp.]|nr:hypothetical protein [Ruminiclostridium sp.]